MTDLSIIILSYKSKQDLERLLPSVYASQTGYSFEVLLVDNGSDDGTAEWAKNQMKNSAFKNFRVIENKNTGFAHGNNVGIKQATGRYILLLNPDTEVRGKTIEIMLNFMESHQDVGISGCRVVKPDGSLDLACRRKFPNPWNAFARLFFFSKNDYNMLSSDPGVSQEVDSVMGAFLLIRRSLADKIGLLDENFFMYGEDIDWCWRCKEAGMKVWYHPQTSIIHYKGSSSKKTPHKALIWFHDAMWIFYKKHYADKYIFLMNWLVFLGIYSRLAILLAYNFFKREKIVSA